MSQFTEKKISTLLTNIVVTADSISAGPFPSHTYNRAVSEFIVK